VVIKPLEDGENGKGAGKIFWGSVQSDAKEKRDEYLVRTL